MPDNLLPTIRSVKPMTHSDGSKGVWMHDSHYHMHTFTADQARILAHELLAAADVIAPPRPRGKAVAKVATKALAKKSAARACRLPTDFIPSPADRVKLLEEFPHITRDEWLNAHRMFLDHWAAAPGQRGTKLDWAATWRNWMRKEFSSPQYRRRAPSSAPSRVDAKAQSYLEG